MKIIQSSTSNQKRPVIILIDTMPLLSLSPVNKSKKNATINPALAIYHIDLLARFVGLFRQ